jgi:hypothetical protein
MHRLIFAASLILTLLLAVTPAMAGPVYDQRFQDDGWYGGVHNVFDLVEGFMVTPGNVLAPPFSNFSVAGWNGFGPNLLYTYGTGPDAGYIQWDIHFGPNPGEVVPFSFDLLVWGHPDSGGANGLLGSTRVNWTGGGWTYGQGRTDYGEADRAAVPEPATLGLIGGGLLGLGVLGRRQRRKTSA